MFITHIHIQQVILIQGVIIFLVRYVAIKQDAISGHKK